MKRTILATAVFVAAMTAPAPPATAAHIPSGITCGMAAEHGVTGFTWWDGTLGGGPFVVDPSALFTSYTCTVQTSPTPGFGVVSAIGVFVPGNVAPALYVPNSFTGIPAFYLCTNVTWFFPGGSYDHDADHVTPGVQCPKVTVAVNTAVGEPRPLVHVD